MAEVSLNDQILGRTDNMFIRYQWPVKQHLKPKLNLIKIKFDSAPQAAKNIYEKIKKEKYSIPPVCTPDVQSGECHANMLRKMQASFSWDWVCLIFVLFIILH